MKKLLSDLWNGEPVLALALISGLVNLAVLYAGVPPEVKAAAIAIVTGLSAFYARSKVSPAE